jgi:hypothetical protein
MTYARQDRELMPEGGLLHNSQQAECGLHQNGK